VQTTTTSTSPSTSTSTSTTPTTAFYCVYTNDFLNSNCLSSDIGTGEGIVSGPYATEGDCLPVCNAFNAEITTTSTTTSSG
jgi:hypothetical protein